MYPHTLYSPSSRLAAPAIAGNRLHMELYREFPAPAPSAAPPVTLQPYYSYEPAASDPELPTLKEPERLYKAERLDNNAVTLEPRLPIQPPEQQVQLSQRPAKLETQMEPPTAYIIGDIHITYVNQQEQETSSVRRSKATKKHGRATPSSAKSTNARSRSKVADPKSWSCNVRKLQHQKGEEYVSRRGKVVPARKVKTLKDCLKSCKYQCSRYVNDTDREHIFKAFYSLNSNEKKHFILNTTERQRTKTSKHNDGEPRRKYSFKYFFRLRDVRFSVCKHFYLGTLAISQKPVYNVHEGKSDANIPKPDGRGMSESSTHKLPMDLKDGVKEHIRSFPVLDTGSNCRPSKKLYLDPSLTVKKMYDMYVAKCNQENRPSVKESMYRRIFTNDFNLHFKTKRKQERCDMCKKSLKND